MRAAAVQADAGSLTYGRDVVGATLQAFPGRTIDVIVNNAGAIAAFPSIGETDVGAFADVFNVNVRGVFLLIQAAEPHLTSPGARIVNVSSIAARVGIGAATFYSVRVFLSLFFAVLSLSLSHALSFLSFPFSLLHFFLSFPLFVQPFHIIKR